MKISKSVFGIICFFILLYKSDADNILCLFLSSSRSHSIVLKTITKELLKRGHHLFVVTPIPIFGQNETSPNMTEILVIKESSKYMNDPLVDSNNQDLASQLHIGLDLMINTFSSQFESEEIQQLIKNKARDFDLVLINTAILSTWIFSHVFRVPVIGVSTAGVLPNYLEPLGHLEHVKYYPHFLRKSRNDVPYWKIAKIYNEYVSIQNLFKLYEKKTIETFKEKLDNLPSVSSLYDNIHAMLVNIHPIWVGIYPISQNVFHLGSLESTSEEYKSTEGLQAYLDSSKVGVIYISFGTRVTPSKLPQDTMDEFIKAFSQLPYDVLWKWDKDEIPELPSNVRLFKWIQQAEVLKHPKVKLFITQGGQHSTDEAIAGGVPMIGIPVIFDQFANSGSYVHFGIGKRLDMKTVTAEEIKAAIEDVIGDESYRQNVIKLRTLLQDKPMTPLNKAMWVIEYVLRHGGAKHLQSPSANLSWGEYFELELLFSFLGLFLLSVILFVKSFFVLKGFLFRSISKLEKYLWNG